MSYGTNPKVEYTYDNADRLTLIKHLDGVGAVTSQFTYTYQANDLIKTIVGDGMTFFYDTRRRLSSEVRGFDYDYVYRYDGGGNRTRKILTLDFLHDITTWYHYDIDTGSVYDTRNNRLMWSETIEFDFFGSSLMSTEESFAEGIETPADLAAAAGVLDGLLYSRNPCKRSNAPYLEGYRLRYRQHYDHRQA